MSVLTGSAEDGSGALFICLARLTGEPDPEPLVAGVRVTGDEVRIAWPGGPRQRVVIREDGVSVTEEPPGSG
ncbi:hypothetical protein [Streptomyces sp. 7N604]|uniref:hypothetical protein n=1 Tax=Streptomyces sp. 7N604 TaxID=3457415 RepID=UPI003FD43746